MLYLTQKTPFKFKPFISNLFQGSLLLLLAFKTIAGIYKDAREQRLQKYFEKACDQLELPHKENLIPNKKRFPKLFRATPTEHQIASYYMQSVYGDAEDKKPSDFFGINSKKRSEWDSWTKLRGVSK